MRCFSALLMFLTLWDAFPATAFALGLLFASPVLAASSVASETLDDSLCGSTVEANLAAAQKAMQANDKTTRTALACLIAATASLNERIQNLELGRFATGELRAPHTDQPLSASHR